MDAFRGVTDDFGVRDLGYRGNTFTWQRGTEPENIARERLDRFLAREDWCMMFPRSVVHHFCIYKSDHALIMLNTEELYFNFKQGKRFHFKAMWLASKECQDIVMSS